MVENSKILVRRKENNMPVLVKIQLPRGKERKEIEAAFSEVNDAICRVLHVEGKDVRITINEIDLNRYSVGGVVMSEKENPFD